MQLPRSRLEQIFVVLWLLGFAIHNAALSQPYDLTGLTWQYTFTNPQRAGPQVWREVKLPGHLPQTLPWTSDRRVWLRTQIPAALLKQYENPSVFLGRVNDIDQTFFAGRKIGQTGHFFSNARDFQGFGSAGVSRVYPIGQVPDGENTHYTLTIHVLGFSFAPGLVSGPLLIGEAHELTQRARRADLPIWIRDILWLSIMVFSFCFSLVGIHPAGRDHRNFWLPPLMLSATLGALPHTLPAFELGWTSPVTIWLADFSPYILISFLHIARAVGTRISRFQIFVCAVTYMSSATILILNLDISHLYMWFHIFGVIVILGFLDSLRQAWQARKARREVSPWIYFALIVMVIALVLSQFSSTYITPAIDPLNIGTLLAGAAFLLAMADDNRRDREKLVRKTGELLVAQDTERERIAKELHDGVNQRLAATRFRLERLAAQSAKATADELALPVNELQQTTSDITAMVEGLRTTTIDADQFPGALEQVARRWQNATDARIQITIIGTGTPGAKQAGQIVRIVQETVYNAVRHADASTITMDANLHAPNATIKISDDGNGFDQHAHTPGLGLTSIAERASLANARLSIESKPGKGTKATLEFKVNDPPHHY